MTDNRTTELREKLRERGVKYDVKALRETEWTVNGVIWHANEYDGKLNVYVRNNDMLLTPDQAIAATLRSDNEYEAKMDELLCRLTNGKWSKSRAYSIEFMVSCVDEEYEDAYEKERAELGNGTLTAEQVWKAIYDHSIYATFDGVKYYAEGIATQAIADELNAEFGSGTCEPTEDGCCQYCGEDLIRCDMTIGDGGGAVELDPPIYHNYCPNCGRRVKR